MPPHRNSARRKILRYALFRHIGGGVDIWGDGTATVKHGASLPNELGAVLEL